MSLSLSGFRHDYLNEHQLSNIDQFRHAGVYAKRGMKPTFTTMTYPNHISIATGVQGNEIRLILFRYLGMYQEDHGIIHNSFYDRLLNKSIDMGQYLFLIEECFAHHFV